MSAAVTAAAAAAVLNQQRRGSGRNSDRHHTAVENSSSYNYNTSASMVPAIGVHRFQTQMRQDWSAFLTYLRNNDLVLSQLGDNDILDFLEYLDQFGKTKVHEETCGLFGRPSPPGACPCPLRQPWGSVNALVRRLRIAFDETKGRAAANPFNAPAVTLYLAEVKDEQARARGIVYD